MEHHVLLLVNSYLTPKDPRRGAKFRLHLREYTKRGWQTGLIAIAQRDYTLADCLRNGGFIFEESCGGVPILRNAVIGRLPWGRQLRPMLTRMIFEKYAKSQGKPDLIHCHGAQWAGHAALTLKKHYGVPYVLTEHMSNFAKGRVTDQDLPIVREVFSAAAMTLPVSNALGQTLENSFGSAARPWSVLPNMMDESLFAVRGEERRRNDETIFFTASRLDAIKGFDVLIRAFHGAALDVPAQLRIAGDGPEREKLMRLTEDLGIARQVAFLGSLSREGVMEEMRSASAYVLSSHYETFGIPVVEAFGSGLPVVATRCGGPNDLVDETNGLLVPVEDVDSMASALRRMAAEHATYDRTAISTRCKERFSPAAVLDRLAVVYDNAVAGNKDDGSQQ